MGRYKLWHPQAHQYTWRNPDELDITHKSSYAERYIGIFSFINEYLGSHCTDLTVAFIDPKELGIEKEKWPEMGIETMVCARIGTPGTYKLNRSSRYVKEVGLIRCRARTYHGKLRWEVVPHTSDTAQAGWEEGVEVEVLVAGSRGRGEGFDGSLRDGDES